MHLFLPIILSFFISGCERPNQNKDSDSSQKSRTPPLKSKDIFIEGFWEASTSVPTRKGHYWNLAPIGEIPDYPYCGKEIDQDDLIKLVLKFEVSEQLHRYEVFLEDGRRCMNGPEVLEYSLNKDQLLIIGANNERELFNFKIEKNELKFFYEIYGRYRVESLAEKVSYPEGDVAYKLVPTSQVVFNQCGDHANEIEDHQIHVFVEFFIDGTLNVTYGASIDELGTYCSLFGVEVLEYRVDGENDLIKIGPQEFSNYYLESDGIYILE